MFDACGAAAERLAAGLDAPFEVLKVLHLERERLHLPADAEHLPDLGAVSLEHARVVLRKHRPGDGGVFELRLALLQTLLAERGGDASRELVEQRAAPAFPEVGGNPLRG